MDNGAKVTCYELLAIAICKTAADDYARELISSDKAGEKTNGAKAIERFFLSDWGDALSFGKGAVILETLQAEHKKKTYRMRKAYTRSAPTKKQRKE